MKRKLFYSVCLLAYSLFTSSLNAQTISFEAAEGFTLGSINAQKGWKVTSGPNNTFVAKQEINNEKASQGTQSLKIANDPTIPPQQNAIIGAFYDFAPLGSSHFTVEADLYISEASANSSNFEFSIAGDQTFIALFQFNYEKNFTTVEPNASNQLEWSPIPSATWQPATWYRIKIEVLSTEVKYYLDGNLIRTGKKVSNEFLHHMRFTHDNYQGFAYVDNIVTTNITPAGNFTPEKFKFNVYPNPTKDIVNIRLEENHMLHEIQIYDLNGRHIKTHTCKDTNETSIDVSDLATGMYTLKINSEGAIESKKLIKE